MLRRTGFFVIISLLFLFGCANNERDSAFKQTSNDSLELTKLSTQGVTDQQQANEAKHFLSQFPEVSQVRAVNVDGDLFVAVNVRQRDRFSLDSIENDLRKKLIENQPNMNITLSTDKKFIIELEKLEKQIDKKDLSKKELQKKFDKLKELSKEET